MVIGDDVRQDVAPEVEVADHEMDEDAANHREHALELGPVFLDVGLCDSRAVSGCRLPAALVDGVIIGFLLVICLVVPEIRITFLLFIITMILATG